MVTSTVMNNRALVFVTGEDAEEFLQTLITTDLDELEKGELKPGALLSAQGKIQFDFLISRIKNGLRFDLVANHAADFAKRIGLYRLHKKVEISLESETLIVVSWKNDLTSLKNDLTFIDRRFPEDLRIFRHYDKNTDRMDEAEWTALRVAHGIAEGGIDYAFGDVFPHDVNLDQMRGVSFRKGCFIGQEVVSRMQHRGTARRRVLMVTGATDLPAPKTSLTVHGREIGILGSVSQHKALALVRIDHVKNAMDVHTPILAGDVVVTCSIPPGARFIF